jgi:hypothetical protein
MIVKAKPSTKPPGAKAIRFLDGLAAKYKKHFAQSTKSETTFLTTDKRLEEARTKNLGLGRQSALDRWLAGKAIAEAEQALGEASYRGGLKAWCATNGIAYSTARQARDLYTNLTEEQVRGLMISDALKQTGQIKDRTDERIAKTKTPNAENMPAAETDRRATKEADEVLGSSNGHDSSNGQPAATDSPASNNGTGTLPVVTMDAKADHVSPGDEETDIPVAEEPALELESVVDADGKQPSEVILTLTEACALIESCAGMTTSDKDRDTVDALCDQAIKAAMQLKRADARSGSRLGLARERSECYDRRDILEFAENGVSEN